MPLTPVDWNVVVIGRWNRAILTPQGIATRLFQLPSGTEVGVEVPMDSIGPYRVSHDGLVVMVGNTQLIVEATTNDFVGLQKAMLVAHRAMSSLPETPVAIAGFNVRSRGEAGDDRLSPLIEATQLQWDRQFREAGFHITRRDVTWIAEWDSGKIAVNLSREQEDRQLLVNVNFEQVGERQALMDWLARPIDQVKEQVSRIATQVFGLNLEVAEWLQ